jgi:hypothetical protein
MLRSYDIPLNISLELDIRIILTWDTDMIDMELHVVEPDGQKCHSFNNHTTNGINHTTNVIYHTTNLCRGRYLHIFYLHCILLTLYSTYIIQDNYIILTSSRRTIVKRYLIWTWARVLFIKISN